MSYPVETDEHGNARGEWEALPPFSVHKLMISSTIPYNYRWRINQIKLMLNDLKELYEKHKVEAALHLYNVVVREAEYLFQKLEREIDLKREKIRKVTK